MVAASSGLLMVGGVGLTIGPILGGIAIDLVGANGFWIYLFLIHGIIGLFTIYRMSIRDSVPLEEQGTAVAIGSRASRLVKELYPDAEETSEN